MAFIGEKPFMTGMIDYKNVGNNPRVFILNAVLGV